MDEILNSICMVTLVKFMSQIPISEPFTLVLIFSSDENGPTCQKPRFQNYQNPVIIPNISTLIIGVPKVGTSCIVVAIVTILVDGASLLNLVRTFHTCNKDTVGPTACGFILDAVEFHGV
jgi:hypothetical protein